MGTVPCIPKPVNLPPLGPEEILDVDVLMSHQARSWRNPDQIGILKDDPSNYWFLKVNFVKHFVTWETLRGLMECLFF